jgi:hypothetical protein
VAVAIRSKRALAELPAGFICGDESVGRLVGVRSECHHLPVSFNGGKQDRLADKPESRRNHAPMKSRQPVFYIRRAAIRMQATPERARRV